MLGLLKLINSGKKNGKDLTRRTKKSPRNPSQIKIEPSRKANWMRVLHKSVLKHQRRLQVNLEPREARRRSLGPKNTSLAIFAKWWGIFRRIVHSS